jgi:hypothetical protein
MVVAAGRAPCGIPGRLRGEGRPRRSRSRREQPIEAQPEHGRGGEDRGDRAAETLLGSASASNDPVGRLSPRTHLPAAPHWTVRPTSGRPHDEGADD